MLFSLSLPAVTTMLFLRTWLSARLTQLIDKIVAKICFKFRQRRYFALGIFVELIERHNSLCKCLYFLLNALQWHRGDALMEPFELATLTLELFKCPAGIFAHEQDAVFGYVIQSRRSRTFELPFFKLNKLLVN